MSRFAFIFEDPEYYVDMPADIDEQDMSPDAHLPSEEFADFD